MDLTALRIRDQLYAIDKGAGKPWAGTVAELVELTGSDKRRVPDAIFQLMDDGTPIEYRNGTITFAGIAPAAPEPVTAAAYVVETTDVVLSYEELANRAKLRAATRRQERWDSERAAGQLTIFDIPDAPERPTTRIHEERATTRERFPTQTAAALRVRPAEQRSNEATVAPLHDCLEKGRVGELLGRIAERLNERPYISTPAPACAHTSSKNNNIYLNQSIQSLSDNNTQEPEITPETAREIQRIVDAPRLRKRPDMEVFNETDNEIRTRFPELAKRLREQLAYMRAWGGLSPNEYHGLIDDAQRARAPCAWLNTQITAWLGLKKWHKNWRAKDENTR